MISLLYLKKFKSENKEDIKQFEKICKRYKRIYENYSPEFKEHII